MNLSHDLQQLTHAEQQIQSRYLSESRRKIYTALEDLNFVWDEQDVVRFDAMWKSGQSIAEIAHELQRDIDDVAVLAMDRNRRYAIRPRLGGVFGNSVVQRRPGKLTMEIYLSLSKELSDARIAKEYGVHPMTVHYHKKKWGLMK